MSSHYPPPPGPEEQHYNPVYPGTNTGAQPLLDAVQQEQLGFSHLAQPSPYPKAEDSTLDANASAQIEQRIEQLQHQNDLVGPPAQEDPQQQHQHQHHDLTPQSVQHLQGQNGIEQQGETPSKVNRLRKACDSCSIRKVKVSLNRWLW